MLEAVGRVAAGQTDCRVVATRPPATPNSADSPGVIHCRPCRWPYARASAAKVEAGQSASVYQRSTTGDPGGSEPHSALPRHSLRTIRRHVLVGQGNERVVVLTMDDREARIRYAPRLPPYSPRLK